jgi:cysteine desulfurase/selenocysteine lyase
MNKVIYLDAAASSLKPQFVIDRQSKFLRDQYANAGRGVCSRAVSVDDMVAKTRACVAKFINSSADNIVFTSGTTDGLNRIARIMDASNAVSKDSVVVVSDLDHHSARLPWEEMARVDKCKIKTAKLDRDFNIDLSEISRMDVLVITAMSNVLGRGQDIKKLIKDAKHINPDVITIVDAAQYVAHLPVDAVGWDCDFLCFSGHKIGADTGVGIMYVKEPGRWRIDKLGGGMVATVERNQGGSPSGAISAWVPADGPARYEAGTLPLTQIAGLDSAIDFWENNRPNQELIKYLHGELSRINEIEIFTGPDDALLSFRVRGMHCLDFGSLIGARGVCLRVGNMCAFWMHNTLGVDGSVRISTGWWNTVDEIKYVAGLVKTIAEKK